MSSPSVKTIYKILLVDDDEFVLHALSQLLEREGFAFSSAGGGEEAIALLKREKFALILCDQRMPGMSGTDVLKEAQSLQPDAVRIVLTACGDLQTAVDSINVGKVFEYIQKPWEERSLLRTLHLAMDSFCLKKENELLNEKIRQQHTLLENDLKLGAQIHKVLLLGEIPEKIPGIAIAAMTIPSREIDGDFFDFYEPSSQILDLVIGDVMGKGIPAALVGTALKTQLARFAVPSHTVHIYEKKEGWWDDILSPVQILENLHQETVNQLIELDYFASLFYARIDWQERRLSFVDCGFTKPIHYHADTGEFTTLAGHNFPLGVVKECHYSLEQVSFAQGDFFLFYSDGVTEAQSREGELYGEKRLLQVLRAEKNLHPEALLQKIKQEVQSFSGREDFLDDLTMILLRVDQIVRETRDEPRSTLFSTDLSQLSALRDYVHSRCLEAPFDGECLSRQLQLALNEAFCNIVIHGYGRQTSGKIAISSRLLSDGILFELTDQGKSFDPKAIEEPNLAGDKCFGFGVYIIKQVSDRVTYIPKRGDGGVNRLQIMKRFNLSRGPMKVLHEVKDNVLLVGMEGQNLDAKESPVFKDTISTLIVDHDINKVVMDLKGIEFIDSSGLGSILSILRLLHRQGGDLKIAGLTKSVRAMFELVCMHKIFEIYNTPEEAVRSFTPRSGK